MLVAHKLLCFQYFINIFDECMEGKEREETKMLIKFQSSFVYYKRGGIWVDRYDGTIKESFCISTIFIVR